MGIAFQIICAFFIILAAAFFVFQERKKQTGVSKMRMILTVFQIILCGWFFALCLSDFLDHPVNFSSERTAVNIFYIIAFLAITIYTFFNRTKERNVYFKGVIWAYILLIVVQCFVFPYGSDYEALRIFEMVEGAVVFGLLIALLIKTEDAVFGQKALMIAVILELIVAIENVFVPMASITKDFQLIDIPLNYSSLFMRPVLFASLALAYRARLDRRKMI